MNIFGANQWVIVDDKTKSENDAGHYVQIMILRVVTDIATEN